MLKLALILFSLVVWVSIFAYFWWPDIVRWFDNRFGKDSLPHNAEEEEEEHNKPLFAETELKESAPAKSESTSTP